MTGKRAGTRRTKVGRLALVGGRSANQEPQSSRVPDARLARRRSLIANFPTQTPPKLETKLVGGGGRALFVAIILNADRCCMGDEGEPGITIVWGTGVSIKAKK